MAANITPPEIARTLHLNKRTVYRWVKKIAETDNINNLPRSGAPRQVTEAVEDEIIRTARRSPLTTAVAIKKKIRCRFSVDTVGSVLHRNGLHHRTPASKPFLTDRNKEERLGFALEHLTKGDDFWRKVVYCDEKTFNSDAHGGLHCWRPDNTR